MMYLEMSRGSRGWLSVMLCLGPFLLGCSDQTTLSFRSPSPEPTTTPDPGQPTPTPDPGQPVPTPDPGQPVPTLDPGQPTPAPDPAQPTPTPDPGQPTPTPDPGQPTPTPDPTPVPSPTVQPSPTPQPSPTLGGFGCIATDIGDTATSEDLDAVIGTLPGTISAQQGDTVISGPVTWTQGIASDPAFDLEVFAIDPDRGRVDLDVSRFLGTPFSASEVGCGGATQPGASCTFTVTLPTGALELAIPPGDQSENFEAEFTFFDGGGATYTCTSAFLLTR